MPNRSIIAIVAFSLAAVAAAGENSRGSTDRPGLFFAWLSADTGGPVFVRFSDGAYLQNLARHCNAGNDVFSMTTGEKAKCRVVVPEGASGREDWDAAEVTVQRSPSKADADTFGLGVFSPTPPRTVGWISRSATREEIDALSALLASDDQKFGKMRDQLKLADATTVYAPGGSSFSLIVPGRTVEDVDGFYSAQYHHVFLRRNGKHSYLGEIFKPLFFVDLDGHDLPGVVTFENCDGTCISLVSITASGVEGIGRFGGH